MLSVENLHVSYGAIKALHGVSLNVPQGSIVTLIGANGAGKSTTLRALSGLVKTASGSIRYQGEDITGLPAHKIVSRNLCHVPEGRMVFATRKLQKGRQIESIGEEPGRHHQKPARKQPQRSEEPR